MGHVSYHLLLCKLTTRSCSARIHHGHQHPAEGAKCLACSARACYSPGHQCTHAHTPYLVSLQPPQLLCNSSYGPIWPRNIRNLLRWGGWRDTRPYPADLLNLSHMWMRHLQCSRTPLCLSRMRKAHMLKTPSDFFLLGLFSDFRFNF